MSTKKKVDPRTFGPSILVQDATRARERDLRDDFAKVALAWILPTGEWDDYDDMARSAYLVADAMLSARKATP